MAGDKKKKPRKQRKDKGKKRGKRIKNPQLQTGSIQMKNIGTNLTQLVGLMSRPSAPNAPPYPEGQQGLVTIQKELTELSKAFKQDVEERFQAQQRTKKLTEGEEGEERPEVDIDQLLEDARVEERQKAEKQAKDRERYAEHIASLNLTEAENQARIQGDYAIALERWTRKKDRTEQISRMGKTELEQALSKYEAEYDPNLSLYKNKLRLAKLEFIPVTRGYKSKGESTLKYSTPKPEPLSEPLLKQKVELKILRAGDKYRPVTEALKAENEQLKTELDLQSQGYRQQLEMERAQMEDQVGGLHDTIRELTMMREDAYAGNLVSDAIFGAINDLTTEGYERKIQEARQSEAEAYSIALSNQEELAKREQEYRRVLGQAEEEYGGLVRQMEREGLSAQEQRMALEAEIRSLRESRDAEIAQGLALKNAETARLEESIRALERGNEDLNAQMRRLQDDIDFKKQQMEGAVTKREADDLRKEIGRLDKELKFAREQSSKGDAMILKQQKEKMALEQALTVAQTSQREEEESSAVASVRQAMGARIENLRTREERQAEQMARLEEQFDEERQALRAQIVEAEARRDLIAQAYLQAEQEYNTEAEWSNNVVGMMMEDLAGQQLRNSLAAQRMSESSLFSAYKRQREQKAEVEPDLYAEIPIELTGKRRTAKPPPPRSLRRQEPPPPILTQENLEPLSIPAELRREASDESSFVFSTSPISPISPMSITSSISDLGEEDRAFMEKLTGGKGKKIVPRAAVRKPVIEYV